MSDDRVTDRLLIDRAVSGLLTAVGYGSMDGESITRVSPISLLLVDWFRDRN